MAWTTLSYNFTNSAEDVNDQFQHIRSGDMLPLSGSAMVAADNTYDLGSSIYKWNEIHVENLDLAADGSVDNTWQLISEVTLSGTAATIEFTGLNGDSEEMYHIIMKRRSANTSYSYFFFNNDSGTNYGYQKIRALGATPTAARAGSQQGQNILYTAGETSTALNAFCELWVYAKSGYERLVLSQHLHSGGETWMYFKELKGDIWNNTSATITSMKLTGICSTNTSIQIWAANYNTGVDITTT